MEKAQLIQILASSGLFLVVWYCFRSILNPFLKNVEERQARTFGDEEAAQEKRQKVKLLDVEIEELLRQARHEGAQVRDAKVAQAKQEAQKVIEQAETWAAAEIENGEDEVAVLKQRALCDVAGEVEKLSRLVVDRALSSGSGSPVVH